MSNISSNTKLNWIWMKEDTDGLTLAQLQQLIFEDIWGSSANEILDEEVEKRLNDFIPSFHITKMKHKTHKVSDNPESILMKKQKGFHMTYNERLLVYKNHRYNGKTFQPNLTKIRNKYLHSEKNNQTILL